MDIKPTRNLLILHTPGHQALSDWHEVKGKIEARAPDIEVRIANNDARNSVTRRWQVSRPSLVFSAAPLRQYRPAGGKVYAGRALRHLAKEEELSRLRAAGLPVPETVRLTPGLRLSGEPWGEYVVVKPVMGWKGKMVRVVRTDELARRHHELTKNGTVPMLVQPYIDHVDSEGRHASYRVLTLFGVELYVQWRYLLQRRPPLADLAANPAAVVATNTADVPHDRRISYDAEVIKLARTVSLAFPEIPVLGVDILRETGTGRLYIMECNPSGLVWHISSDNSRNWDPEFLRAIRTQFSALDRTANLLIEKTRAEAV